MFNYDYSIWDYRGMPFNYEGHITLSFAILWFVFISPFIIWWGDKWRGKNVTLLGVIRRFYTLG
jgi:hypothetical protein